MPPTSSSLLSLLTLCSLGGVAFAQNPGESTPYAAGDSLAIVDRRAEQVPRDARVAVYGAVVSAESCVYDSTRGLIAVVNRGERPNVQLNDAFVSLLRPDGSVHTPRWIGAQHAAARPNLDPPLTLNEPLDSEIAGSTLYIADRDGGSGPDDPTVAVVRRFDLATGRPVGETRIDDSPWVNDLAVGPDGTVSATQTGDFGPDPDLTSFRVYRITPDGEVSVLVEGAPLRMPKGIALDERGQLVVLNSGDSAVHTFSLAGELLRTEYAAQGGSDGIVVLPEGTKYVSSVFEGGISRIRPGQPAELIVSGLPGAASMCYDPTLERLVVPLAGSNGLAFVPIE